MSAYDTGTSLRGDRDLTGAAGVHWWPQERSQLRKLSGHGEALWGNLFYVSCSLSLH